MKLLSVDTSSSSGSIAIVSDGRLVSLWSSGDVGRHAEWLLPSIDALLKSVGMTVNDIDRFAVATGPGSFTGLRIGVSVIKGLAWALGKPVTGVSTLRALALNLRYSAMPVVPILDARKKEVYAALYKSTGAEMEAVINDAAFSPALLIEQVSGLLAEGVEPVFLGEGLRVYGELLREAFPGALIAPESEWQVRASNIAELALPDVEGTVDAALLVPLYRRKSEAEFKLCSSK